MQKTSDNKKESGRWATDQHQRFLAAIATHGKDWKKVQQIVATRSGSQVRSHAQKFFNKLLKDEKRKKSDVKAQKRQRLHQHQDEESFMKYIHDNGSIVTPVELVSLIRKQSQQHHQNKINIERFQRKLEQKMFQIHQQKQQIIEAQKWQKKNTFKGMSNILKAYQQIKKENDNNENQQMQSQSFLLKLTRYYKKIFNNGGKFQNLIDFGQPHCLQKEDITLRKRSFTLPEGVQGDQNILNQRKKRIILGNINGNQREQQKTDSDHIEQKRSRDQVQTQEQQFKQRGF